MKYRLTQLTFLFAATTLGWVPPAAQCDAEEQAKPTPLSRGVDYLMSRQADDGGFKSTTYGALKGGAATTSLTLYAMSHVAEDLRKPHAARLQAGYDFLRPGIKEKGKVAVPDGSLDYPLYGSALTYLAARRLKLDAEPEEFDALLKFIIEVQLTEDDGVAKDSLQYGGWDLEAASGAGGDAIKGTNISLASFALEALSESMHADASAAIRRGHAWLAGAQNDDGGFVFHAWRTHPGNKAAWEDDAMTKARSYGGPTCDGLRSLIYCGQPHDGDAVKSAIAWLAKHEEVATVPGFEGKAKKSGWPEGLRYYYYFSQAKCLHLLPEAEAKRRANKLVKILTKNQHKDGSFKNDQPRMFEDDDLIATNLAVIALALSEPYLD